MGQFPVKLMRPQDKLYLVRSDGTESQVAQANFKLCKKAGLEFLHLLPLPPKCTSRPSSVGHFESREQREKLDSPSRESTGTDKRSSKQVTLSE